MEGRVISKLLSEDNLHLVEGQWVYHPAWGFGKVNEIDVDRYTVRFKKKDMPDVNIEAGLPHLAIILRTIVFVSKQPRRNTNNLHPGYVTNEYPVPVRFWEDARNKGWLDHPKIIEADIMDGVAILYGPCNVGCS